MDLINLSIANNKLVIQEDQARLDLLFRAWEDIELENFDRPTSVPTHNLSHHLGPWKSVFKFKKSSTTKADDQEDSVKYSSNVNRQSFRHSTFSFVSVHSVTSLYPKHLTEDQSQKYDWPVHFITEFTILLRRYWKVERRSLKNNLSLFFEFVIIALIFGFLYFQLTLANFGGFQSRLGLLFYTQYYMYVLATEICSKWTKSRQVTIRERSSGTYRTITAYIARFLSLLPLRFCSVLLFATIIYYLAGLRTDSFGYFLLYMATILSSLLCALCFGMAVAGFVTDIQMAITVTYLIEVTFLLFSGLRVNLLSVTPIVRWIRFVSPVCYAMNALMQNECNGLTFGGVSGNSLVAEWNLDVVPIGLCILALLCFALIYFILGYIGFSRTTKPKYIIL